MTNKESLQAIFTGFEVSESLFEKVLIDRGVNGSEMYSATYAKEVDLCAAELCQTLLTPSSISEGGLSIQYDRKALKDLRYRLLSKHELPVDGLKIDGTSIW